MGMAASQARLLMITARLHDVEYEAQTIQNAKIQLANQSDQVYEEYLEALDATTLTVMDQNKNMIVANFNNLTGRNAVETGNKYVFRSSDNKLIVPDEIAEAYYDFDGTDPYQFAMFMIGNLDINEAKNNLTAAEDSVFKNNQGDESDNRKDMEAIQEKMDKLKDEYGDPNSGNWPKDVQEQYDRLMGEFRAKLYQSYGDQIFAKAFAEDAEDFNRDDFKYYADIFQQIKQAGGCIPISSYDNGENSDVANSSEWLQNMIQCGKITIQTVTDNKDGTFDFNTTSPSSDSYISYTTTSQIDKTALAKAEAEYEHKTRAINKKDEKYDLDLSKLETERTALTTEYESVKKVINDNIERTFGIFS